MIWSLLFGIVLLFGGDPPQFTEEAVEEIDGQTEEVPVVESKEDANAAKLRWTNSEIIAGELKDATATEFSWKSSLFEDPLRLRWDAVRRIDQVVASAAAPESFSIALRDGSHLVGDLVGMNADGVTIKSVRHGEAVLKRSEVLRLVRLRGGKIIAAGPSGDVGWKSTDGKSDDGANQVPGLNNQSSVRPPAAVAQVITGPGGSLVLPYWNAKATFTMKTPARMEFEIDLRFAETPAFALRFDSNANDGIRLETWDDELVVARANQFQFIRKIDPKERQVALRFCWDREAKTGIVFSAAGEQLAKWKFTGSTVEGRDWWLHNKGRQLTLKRFRVREWDGKPPVARPNFDAPSVQLADGRILTGSVAEISEGSLKIAGESAAQPLAEVAEIILSTDEPKPDPNAPTLAFADSTVLHGRIVSIADGRAALETRIAAAPLPVAIAGLRQLRFPEVKAKEGEAKPDAPQDEIQIDGAKFHGALTASENGRFQWLPFGGVKAVAPKRAASLKLTRALPPEPAVVAAPALIYTSFGDVLPANFRGLSGDRVEIESDLFEAKTLPISILDAVQFGDVTQTKVTSFEAPGWRVLKGDPKNAVVAGNSIELQPGSAFGHPSVLQSDMFRFSFDPQESVGFRVRLFSGGGEKERTTNFLIGTNSANVYVSVEENDGQGRSYNNAPVALGKPVIIRIEIKDSMAQLFVGDRMLQQATCDPKRRSGSGVVFEPSDAIFSTEAPVKFTDFSTTVAPGRIWLPEINPEMKTQALTVPRFRKERPPRHALVASNGDVLRGEIEATTGTHFSFLSGLEKLRIPRARVNAAIWLKPPGKDTATAETSAASDALDRLFTRTVRYGGASLSSLLAVLTREMPGVTINNKAGEGDKRRVSFQFSRQTVRESIEQICALFEVRFRVEENGSVTIENGAERSAKFVEKSYWLRGDAFPDADSGQTRLVEKGIEFPEGTNARWDAATRQLIVKQSAAAHAKIEGVLKKEFGAGYSTLTHWLLLTNGGRIGLSVEKFGEDFITGTHPEYGQCRIPTPLVFTIQTARPPASSAMQALANWRLRPAKEPVIPESGGESSPTLAKDAPTFKLPLLAGGDFDLKAEQGKIVVLDFWATWCGPCIKSIPGLIEAVSAFPADRVKLIGLNQGEPADTVKKFLEAREWKLTVALDSAQKVAGQYGVSGIPHTVIVGPDGKVAWVKTGYSPEGPAEAAEAIKKLLEAPVPEGK